MSKQPIPILFFLDFKAAFPSVSHRWLMDVLSAMKVPMGLHAYISELYRKCDLYFSLFGQDIYVCILRAGVIQGCPLSGTLFSFVIDIFLEFMYQEIYMKGRGEIAACADDIGGACQFSFKAAEMHFSPNCEIGNHASQNMYVRVDLFKDTQMAE
eukprot:1105679-Karenia_brevis.AAC.1